MALSLSDKVENFQRQLPSARIRGRSAFARFPDRVDLFIIAWVYVDVVPQLSGPRHERVVFAYLGSVESGWFRSLYTSQGVCGPFILLLLLPSP